MADHTIYPVTGMIQPVTTHDVQSAVARIPAGDDADWVELKGQRFRIANETGVMPLLMFAHAANEGLDSNDMAGLAAMYVMVRDCIDGEDEWRRFVRHAVLTKATSDELMQVINRTVEILTARPTTPPGSSSPGRPDTSDGSKVPSSSPATTPRRVPDGLEDLVMVDDLLAGRLTA